jgi:predicted metal-dependent HD superfamily phosphohydrolase
MSSQYTEIYNSIYSHILAKLQTELSHRFTYHSINHTLDVLEQVQQIAAREGIKDKQKIYLLKVAALYHDIGFLFIYSGHEEKGCELARNELPGFGLKPLQIKKICGMIMATKIPQSPKNKMEEIICDADLDYLGRDDVDFISNNLYKEFLDFGFVKDHDDWMRKQIGFFEMHNYFTKSSQELRHPEKMKQLAKLKAYFLPANQ